MASEDDNTGQPRRRRSSIAELFASRPSIDPSSAHGNNTRPFQSSVATSVTHQAQQHSRRLSITTLGLSGSPNQANPATPFGSLKRGSVAPTIPGRRASQDFSESAIEDGDPAPLASSAPESTKPMGRRLSFGARAYGNLRSGGGSESSSDGTSPAKTSSTPTSRGSEGFNWSDNLLNRAKRTSISAMPGGTGGASSTLPIPVATQHNRADTIAAAQPPPPLQPAKILQKPPDHFQERILKGDFYMD